MKYKMPTLLGGAVLAAAILAAITLWLRADHGQARYFEDQTYHFQTLRALSNVPYGGADTAEVLETIRHIRSGDARGWFEAWEATGDRVKALADNTSDPLSRGRALLRAHNYYRTAEFFLPPDDPERPLSYARNQATFYEGLSVLGVAHERLRIPYGDHHLNAVYYPGPESARTRPLIVFVGGYDSTLEELYFALAAAALERGYSVLTYEGPGQGAVLREQGLPFTHEWERPTRAVMDYYLASGHPAHDKYVLVGMSLGGYLAPRAAAFDDRFDGVVAFDVLFDAGEISAGYVPSLAFWLEKNGLGSVLEVLLALKAAADPGFAWAKDNSQWMMGTDTPLDTVRAFEPFTLEGVAEKIEADVLILAGAEDHFVPFGQIARFERSLVNARSVTTAIYDRASGGAEHCQEGARTLWHATFFDWMMERFPSVDG